MRRIERYFKLANRALFYQGVNLDYGRLLDCLSRLANEIDNYSGEINWFLGEGGPCALDSMIVETYWFCVEHHSGQWSDEYRLSCEISRFFRSHSDAERGDVYQALEGKHARRQ